MTLLNYATHTSVAGAKDLLSKLRTFATTYGWVSENYQVSKAWAAIGGGSYGWVAGDQDFLDLSSTGYGSQVLRMRLLVDPYDALDDTLYNCPINPTNVVVSTTSATSPHLQQNQQTTNWNRTSLPKGTIPQVWFFGNAHFILVVAQVSATAVVTFAFGLPELDSGMQDESMMFHWPGHYMADETATYSWQNLSTYYTQWWNCLGWVGGTVGAGTVAWWGAAIRSSEHYKTNMRILTTAVAGEFNQLDDVLSLNGFSGKRTMVRPTVFLKDTSTGVWYPAGNMATYYTIFSGLTIGQTLTYGAEEYLIFPTLLNSYTYGMAVRIL
jgi:hypothetical protein